MLRPLNLQPLLQRPAGRLFVLVERMDIDVQSGRELDVAQEASHRCNVRAVCDEETCVGVPQGVDVQVLRQAMLFQDQLEPPGEGGGRHGKTAALAAEQEVPVLQRSAVIGFGFPYTLPAVFPQINGFSTESGVEAVDSLVNRGGFSSMLSLVGILLVLGMLSGLFTETGVLNVLVDKLSKRLNTPGGILLGVWISALLICLIGGQYPAIAITAVAFKGACDKMDINRAVLSRTLEDVGTMVAGIIPWNAWVIGYGVVLGGVSVQEFIPYTFLCMLCPILALIHNFLGIGLLHKDDEVRYRPFWRRKKS